MSKKKIYKQTREIKFRAWNYYHRAMVYSDLMEDENMDEYFSKLSEFFHLVEGVGEPLSMDKVMQYTGLKDKNGKEIYEGDVVKYYLPTLKTWHSGKVEWNEDWAAFWLNGKDWSELDWVKLEQKEVIGNIFENKDLLD